MLRCFAHRVNDGDEKHDPIEHVPNNRQGLTSLRYPCQKIGHFQDFQQNFDFEFIELYVSYHKINWSQEFLFE